MKRERDIQREKKRKRKRERESVRKKKRERERARAWRCCANGTWSRFMRMSYDSMLSVRWSMYFWRSSSSHSKYDCLHASSARRVAHACSPCVSRRTAVGNRQRLRGCTRRGQGNFRRSDTAATPAILPRPRNEHAHTGRLPKGTHCKIATGPPKGYYVHVGVDGLPVHVIHVAQVDLLHSIHWIRDLPPPPPPPPPPQHNRGNTASSHARTTQL